MIGLILGDTNFPREIIKKIKRIKINYLIIDLTKKNIFKNEQFSHKVFLGQFGKIIRILKDNKCNKVLFAGKVNKPNLSKIRLDLKGIYYISKIIKSSKLGDAAILKEVIKILKKEKINTISSLTFNPELSLKRGNYTTTKPNKYDKIDIKEAIRTLSKLNMHNYSQGVVVRNKKVIAVEGRAGTQDMLRRSQSKRFPKSGVLVKFPKKKQDIRIDLPTVGYKTLQQCKISGIKGIILKSKRNIFLERNKCIKFANKNNIFIKVK